jgi:hypothetical protein
VCAGSGSTPLNLGGSTTELICLDSAGLPEKRRQKYMKQSETFRGVSTLAKNNVSLRSRMAVAQSIMGRKPSYYKMINPSNKQPVYIELKEILPNVNAAMWWLEKVDKIDKVEDNENPYENPPLGAPRNEFEAELLAGLLRSHTDYVLEKQQKLAKNTLESDTIKDSDTRLNI